MLLCQQLLGLLIPDLRNALYGVPVAACPVEGIGCLGILPLGQQQLRQGGAVAATAFAVQKLQNFGRGRGLDGKVFPIAGIPGKGLLQTPGACPDARLIIDVEGGGILPHNGLQLLFCDKWRLHFKIPVLFSLFRAGMTLFCILRGKGGSVKKLPKKRRFHRRTA